MLVVLDRPLVTDYLPLARPPWLLLVVMVVLVGWYIPRDSLPITIVAVAAVLALAGTANWLWGRRTMRPTP